MNGLSIPLEHARLALGSASGGVYAGQLRGFLSTSIAAEILIDASVPIVGGRAVSSLLPGGKGSCAPHSDLDAGPGGEEGWWMYIDLRAVPVTWNP
jgi:hypothetical protein